MALRYRVTVFGRPRGPWRLNKRQAEQDAVAEALAEYDADGQVWLDAVATIQWVRDDALRMRA